MSSTGRGGWGQSPGILGALRALPFSPTDLDAALAPLGEARPLPPRAYWDEEVFAFEEDAIFGRAWQCVGREDEVERPGEWLLAPVTGEGVIVVRGADLALRAFYNVCRHRAATLLAEPCGPAERIACPYHGWTYELAGALREAPGAPADFDRGAHGLVPVSVASWRGFLFVSLDPGAPDLAESLAGAPPWLDGIGPLRRAGRVAYETRANWKLCVENFQESHHFTRVHPALERLTPNARATSVIGDGPWLGGVMPLADGAETVSKSASRRGRPFLVPGGDHRRIFDAMLFPTLLTSLQPDYLLTYRLYPRAPDRTLVVADTYLHPAAFSPDLDAADVLDFWDVVNREDRAICERQQAGLRSRGALPSPFLSNEDGVHAFVRLLVRRYVAACGWRARDARGAKG